MLQEELSTVATRFWGSMLSCAIHRAELKRRLDTVVSLLDAAHGLPIVGVAAPVADISKEVRGLSIVLIYASYENLLTSLCRSLLEAVQQMRVGNRRLRPGLQLVAAHPKLQAIAGSKSTAIWKSGLDVVDVLSQSKSCTVSPYVFPNDGTNFRTSQVRTFCDVFALGDPAPILREVWQRIDTIVVERNSVAHGEKTPDDIGRNYSEQDVRNLVALWQLRWGEFITWVENAAASRDFFRAPR
ncbi:hypothetical protein SAMN04488074_12818 [Lentzea albidocapillata subsp. violacea]|uniref:Uncharacterized protein n=1 Tax=Lentzea albidocapillata subsp. violacea TaxID=128104 RepID=A0A1G9WN52_9PSEU|nr:MAE_28990/MAE_18760 family HEPN-like nuclease [Lentzea albidocapillata]SDM85777.1 hypothetical protein SAMN04488074_12818 [Lentzea albidocapillata subsp. violacea]